MTTSGRKEDVRLVVTGVLVFVIGFFVFDLIRKPIAAYIVQSTAWDLPPSGASVSVAAHVQSQSAKALGVLKGLGLMPFFLMAYAMARQRAESTLVLALAVTAVALLFTAVPGDFRQPVHYLGIFGDTLFAAGATYLGSRVGSRARRLFESKPC